MRVDQALFEEFVSTPFTNRGHIRAALAHAVDESPVMACVVPAAGGGELYLLGDSYLARVEQRADATTVDVRWLEDVAAVEVSLGSNLALAYMIDEPVRGKLDALEKTLATLTWADGDPWELGGAVWATALEPGVDDPEAALKLIWALVDSVAPARAKFDWPTA